MLLRPCTRLCRTLGRRGLVRPQTASLSTAAAADVRRTCCAAVAAPRVPPAHALTAVRSLASNGPDLPPHREVVLPALSPTMETGTIISWEKSEGDKVNEGDLLAEIETDKASMGFENEEAGYLAKILVPAGTKDIPLGKLLCIIVENQEDVAKFKDYVDTSSPSGAPAAAPAAAAPAPAAAPAAPAAAPTTTTSAAAPPIVSGMPTGRIMASPRARKLAAERGVDLSTVQPGSDGLIRAAHVTSAPTVAPAATPSAPAAAAPSVVPAAAAFEDVELTAMRKTIAKRLLLSKQTIPHYYLTIEVDMTNLLQVRTENNARVGKDGGTKLSVNDFVIKAAALACVQVPEANSSWMDTFIRQYQSVDMCVAVATEHGLITPIVTGAERRGVADISRTVRELAQRARDRKLQPHEFQGGTFSISNLGMFGVRSFSAIINPPQACILAVGGVERRLVPGADGPRPAEFMSVTLSCDHRVVDGAVGAQWLQHFRRYMEQPVTMIL